MNKRTQNIIEMYKNGKSTYTIAKELYTKPTNIRTLLRYYHILRKSPGRDIEEEVERWFEKKGNKVFRRKGDHPYDFFMNGKRYDVKSASLTFDKYMNKSLFKFQLTDGSKYENKRTEKDFTKLDYFLLVFKIDEYPMFLVKASHLSCKFTLSISESLRCKYRLEFLGYLRKRGEI